MLKENFAVFTMAVILKRDICWKSNQCIKRYPHRCLRTRDTHFKFFVKNIILGYVDMEILFASRIFYLEMAHPQNTTFCISSSSMSLNSSDRLKEKFPDLGRWRCMRLTYLGSFEYNFFSKASCLSRYLKLKSLKWQILKYLNKYSRLLFINHH